LIQAASFQVGGSYLVLHFPVLVSVLFGIPQVGSRFFGFWFPFLASISGFIKVRHPIKSCVNYAIMVGIEEISTGTSSEGALAYLIEFVFPKDQDILLSFIEYNGVEDIKDFMSFDKVDFNQPYSTLDKPNPLLSLSSSLIKKPHSPGMVTCCKIQQMTQSRLFILLMQTP
jgi:hypothetical protein